MENQHESQKTGEGATQAPTVRLICIEGLRVALVANVLIVVAVFLSFYWVPKGSFVRPMGLACGEFIVWIAVLMLELGLAKRLIGAQSNGDSKAIAALGLVALGLSPILVALCANHGFMAMWELYPSP